MPFFVGLKVGVVVTFSPTWFCAVNSLIYYCFFAQLLIFLFDALSVSLYLNGCVWGAVKKQLFEICKDYKKFLESEIPLEPTQLFSLKYAGPEKKTLYIMYIML